MAKKQPKAKKRSAASTMPAMAFGNPPPMPKPKVMPAAPPPMAARPRFGIQGENNLARAMKGRK